MTDSRAVSQRRDTVPAAGASRRRRGGLERPRSSNRLFARFRVARPLLSAGPTMRAFAVVVIAASLFACNDCTGNRPPADGGTSGGGTGGGSSDVLADCNAFVNDYCAYLGRCFSLPSPDECRAGLAAFCANTATSVARGFQFAQPGGLQACRQAIGPSTACDDPLAGSCLPVLPAVADGGACLTTNDCLTLSDAEGRALPTVCGAAAGCPSRCEPGGKLGQPCFYRQCEPGLRCDVATNTCSTPLPVDAGCDPSFSSDCGVLARCDFNVRRCVALPGNGEPCPSFECQRGLTCSGFVNGTCGPLRMQGEMCSTFAPSCAAGLACVNDMCQPLAMDGGMCAADDECVRGLACSFGRCAPPKAEGGPCDGVGFRECLGVCDRVLGTCVDYSTTRAPGAACGERQVCDAGACVGLGVGADGGVHAGQCATASAGAACLIDISVPQCAAGQKCIGADGGTRSGPGVCQDIVVGGRCANGTQCVAAEYCESSTQRCAPRRAEGEQCLPDNCQTGLTCSLNAGGRCVRLRGPGESCDAGICRQPMECLAGTCQVTGLPGAACRLCDGFLGCGPATCTVGTCEADAGRCLRPKATGACNDDGECESSRCRDHQCQATCN